MANLKELTINGKDIKQIILENILNIQPQLVFTKSYSHTATASANRVDINDLTYTIEEDGVYLVLAHTLLSGHGVDSDDQYIFHCVKKNNSQEIVNGSMGYQNKTFLRLHSPVVVELKKGDVLHMQAIIKISASCKHKMEVTKLRTDFTLSGFDGEIATQPLGDWVIDTGMIKDTGDIGICFWKKYNNGVMEIFASSIQKNIACTTPYGNTQLYLCTLLVNIEPVKMLKRILYQDAVVYGVQGLFLTRCYNVNVNTGEVWCMIMDSIKNRTEKEGIKFHIVGTWK